MIIFESQKQPFHSQNVDVSQIPGDVFQYSSINLLAQTFFGFVAGCSNPPKSQIPPPAVPNPPHPSRYTPSQKGLNAPAPRFALATVQHEVVAPLKNAKIKKGEGEDVEQKHLAKNQYVQLIRNQRRQGGFASQIINYHVMMAVYCNQI
jgi:hypothetical protein